MWVWRVVAGWVAGCSLSVSLGPLAVCLAPWVALLVPLFGWLVGVAPGVVLAVVAALLLFFCSVGLLD